MPRMITGAVGALLLAVVAAAPARADDPPAWAPVAGLPLTQAQQLYARHGVLKVTLDATRDTITVSDSQVVAQPFNGKLIGPTLHVHPGDTIEVTVRNTTPQDTNIHFHGLHVSPKADGDNVFRTFRPGTTVRSKVTLPRTHQPGTYWYHAHFHGLTDAQLMGGMSGLIVVEGLKKLLPRALRDIPEQQFAIRSLQTAPGTPGITALSFADMDSQGPTTRLVNGLLQPRYALREGQTQLWRLANIDSDLFYDVQLQGHHFKVIAEDGVPVWKVRTADHLVMPPGKRYDVLVTAGAPGRYSFLTRAYPQEGFELLPRTDLMSVDVLPGAAAPAPRVPAKLATTARPLTSRPVARKRTFTFSFGTSKTGGFAALINGKQFDPTKTNVAPVVNTVEEWTLRNPSTEDHPFHIHVNDFQVVSVNGRPYHARGLQDVVTIPHKRNGRPGVVVVRIPFDDFTGHFVFHCHILGHEDAGMMMTVDVVKPGQKPTPPPGAAHAHAHAHLATAAASSANAGLPLWLCRLLGRGSDGVGTAPAPDVTTV